MNLGDGPLFSLLCIEKVFPELALDRISVATGEEDRVRTLLAALPTTVHEQEVLITSLVED